MAVAIRGAVRGQAGSLALGPDPAGTTYHLAGDRRGQGAGGGGGAFGVVPALSRSRPPGRRRGARPRLQAGGRRRLPCPRHGRGKGPARQLPRGAVLGDAVAGDPCQRDHRPLPSPPLAGPSCRGRAAGDRHRRSPPRQAALAALPQSDPGQGSDRDPRGRRAVATVPQPPGICPAHTLPGLRAPPRLSELLELAGRASAGQPAAVPSLRLLVPAAEGLLLLQGGGQLCRLRPGRRAAGRGAAGDPSRRPLHGDGKRHHRRAGGGGGAGPLDPRRRGRCRHRHADGGQGPQLPEPHPGRRGRCRSRPRRRRPARGRANLPAPASGFRPRRPPQAARPRAAADLAARQSRDAGAGVGRSRPVPRGRGSRARGGPHAALWAPGRPHRLQP